MQGTRIAVSIPREQELGTMPGTDGTPFWHRQARKTRDIEGTLTQEKTGQGAGFHR
jgi:hypothetical protein